MPLSLSLSLSLKSSAMSPSDPFQSQGTSTSEGRGSPRSEQPSPSATLTREYTLAVQSTSYNEIWSKIHVLQQDEDEDEDEQEQQRLVLAQVLQPNRECVEEALGHAESNTLTRLVSDYFRHSEDATHLCLLLHRSVYRGRALYAPLHQLLDVLDDSLESISLNQSQCSRALDIFLQFDRHDNPFPSPDSHNFSDSRRRFSDLKNQLDRRLHTSRSKIRRIRRATIASAICLIGTAVGMVAAAAAVTAHALAAFVVVGPLCSSSCCSRMTNKEVAHMTQLDAAAKGTCVLKNDLATIDRLARRLHTAVEGDKDLIRLGLERGAQDKHPIQEVLKQLRKSHPNFLHLLNELDQHICLCFNTVNRARSLLLQQIYTPYNVQTDTDQT